MVTYTLMDKSLIQTTVLNRIFLPDIDCPSPNICSAVEVDLKKAIALKAWYRYFKDDPQTIGCRMQNPLY
jgi:hypothetical protein